MDALIRRIPLAPLGGRPLHPALRFRCARLRESGLIEDQDHRSDGQSNLSERFFDHPFQTNLAGCASHDLPLLSSTRTVMVNGVPIGRFATMVFMASVILPSFAL